MPILSSNLEALPRTTCGRCQISGGPTGTEGTGASHRRPIGISGPAGITGHGAAIRAVAKQLSLSGPRRAEWASGCRISFQKFLERISNIEPKCREDPGPREARTRELNAAVRSLPSTWVPSARPAGPKVGSHLRKASMLRASPSLAGPSAFEGRR